jgi:hypothetical protein
MSKLGAEPRSGKPRQASGLNFQTQVLKYNLIFLKLKNMEIKCYGA